MGPPLRLAPGDTFAEKFRVERMLARGSMGSVFVVVDTLSGERRALKLMNPDLLAVPRFVERFVQEAGIGARIASNHVIRVFEHGVDARSGLPWLAMEYVVGETVDRAVDSNTLDAPTRWELVRQLFDAIAAAHTVNVVHRDLKPENLLMVSVEGRPPQIKVLDFGVAKVIRETTMSMSATAEGLGTPLWTAPEQGVANQIIRPSADVWALGLLTFWLLTGKLFWLGANSQKISMVELAYELIRGPIPLASERARQLGCEGLLPANFDVWFARAVIREPGARFASAGEAYLALAPLLRAPDAQMHACATPTVSPTRASAAPQPPKRPLWPMFALVGTIVVLALR